MVLSKKKRAEKENRNIGLDANPPSKKCIDSKCPWHGTLPLRGRTFVGTVVNANAPKTVTVRWDYNFYITKYERYERRHSSIVVYCPECIELKSGDTVKIAECRPLSKTKSFVVIEKLGEKK